MEVQQRIRVLEHELASQRAARMSVQNEVAKLKAIILPKT